MARKTWKTHPDATAGVQITPDTVSISVAKVGDVNGIFVDETGVYLRGNISIMASPENIRVGGFWTQSSPWLQMIPSTLGFPVPNLIVNPPLKGIADMATAVGWMMGMLV